MDKYIEYGIFIIGLVVTFCVTTFKVNQDNKIVLTMITEKVKNFATTKELLIKETEILDKVESKYPSKQHVADVTEKFTESINAVLGELTRIRKSQEKDTNRLEQSINKLENKIDKINDKN